MKTSLMISMLVVTLSGACGGEQVEPTENTTGQVEDPGKADLVGNKKQGESCLFNAQCSHKEGLLCRPIEQYGIIRGQVCLPPGVDGEACAYDSECADDYMCVGAANGDGMLNSMIKTYAGECTAGAGIRCRFNWQCASGKVCRPVYLDKSGYNQVEQRCLAPAQAGDHCLDTAECAKGLKCHGANHSGWYGWIEMGKCK